MSCGPSPSPKASFRIISEHAIFSLYFTAIPPFNPHSFPCLTCAHYESLSEASSASSLCLYSKYCLKHPDPGLNLFQECRALSNSVLFFFFTAHFFLSTPHCCCFFFFFWLYSSSDRTRSLCQYLLTSGKKQFSVCTAPGVKYSSLIHSSCLSSAFFTTCSHLGCTCLEYTLLLISLNPTSSTQRQCTQERLNPGTQSYPKPACLGSNWDLSGSLASLWSLESLFTF